MKQYGFDHPLLVKYARYLIKLAHGDLEASVYFNNSAGMILIWDETMFNTIREAGSNP